MNGGLTGQASVREVRAESENGNNNSPICVQPKLTEAEFYREIQTTVPILAPEVLAAFANSQIFHEHASSKITSPASPPPGVHQVSSSSNFRSRVDSNAEELLKRLEGEIIFISLWLLVHFFVRTLKHLFLLENSVKLMFVFYIFSYHCTHTRDRPTKAR